MKSSQDHDVLQRRSEQATDWLLRLSEVPQDDALLAEWLDWCAADVENLAEFRRTCDLWNAFDSEELQALLAMPIAQSEVRADTARTIPEKAARHAPLRSPFRRRLRLSIAAAALVMVVGGLIAVRQLDQAERVTHVTEVAQHSADLLADGSRIELGAGSRITSRYSEQMREVDIEKGEAFFEVAKDPERPFIVHAGQLSARAVGTAFNVRTGVNRTIVTVTHGLVEVQSHRWFDLDASSDQRRALAGPGEQVVYEKSSGRMRVEQIDAEVAISWRKGVHTFRFVDEPLADVVAYLNRYTARKVVIRDATLAKRTFTGTVHHDRGDDWLLALEQAYPLQAISLDEQSVLLVPVSQESASKK